jgi:adenylosuccinate lyase
VVYPKVIAKRIEQELPFMATEYIIMACVKLGGDRQELHEKIRVHSMEAGRQVKMEGKPNDLIERILKDPSFPLDREKFLNLLNPKNFIGFSAEQTAEFIRLEVDPILEAHGNLLGMDAELHV